MWIVKWRLDFQTIILGMEIVLCEQKMMKKQQFICISFHGSINWERSNDQLRISQQQGITPDVIFGTDIKMQAIDPYLFYLYEFRKYVLAAEIIITIGYSFNDTHINDLIRQAMEYNKEKKLISVSPVTDVSDEMNRINCRLELHENNDRIIIENKKAKDFLDNTLSVEYIGNKLPEPDLPF